MLSAIAIVLISIFGFIFCICACCAAAVYLCCATVPKLYSALTQKKYRSDRIGSRAAAGVYEPALESDDSEIAMAEAYFVAPLASAVVVSDTDTTSVQEQGLSQTMDVTEARSESVSTEVKFKDAWAALLFLAQVTAVVWLAVRASFSYMNVSDAKDVDSSGLGVIATASITLGAIATVLGSMGLAVLLKYSEAIIEGVMWVNIVFFAISGVITLVMGDETFFMGLVLLLLALVNYWYLYSVRDRIAFASAILSVACQALRDNYNGIITAAYSMLVLQLCWFFLWSVASFGVYQTFVAEDATKAAARHASDDDLSGSQVGIMFLMFLSLYWGSEVVKNLMQTTVAGTVACWWFQPMRDYVVRGSLLRAATTSFGSVCFGSFIVAIIHSIRDTLAILRANARSHRRDRDRESRNKYALLELVLCIAGELFKCLESVMRYVNKFAFCYIAAYGYGFLEAARKVSALFAERGWTAVINDNLVSNALTFALFGMAIMTAVVGALLSIPFGPPLEAAGLDSPMITLSFLGFLMGFAVGIVLINVINSAVAMVFVCLAENPGVLKETHPREYHILTTTWLSFHPMLVTWADGYVAPQSLPPAGYGYGGGPAAATTTAAPVQPPYAHTHQVPPYGQTSVPAMSHSHEPGHKTSAPIVYTNPIQATNAGFQPGYQGYQAPNSNPSVQPRQPFQMPPSPRGGFGYHGYGGYGGYQPPTPQTGAPTPPGTNPAYNPRG